MGKMYAWIIKNLIFPLLPIIIVAIFRSIFQQDWNFEVIEPGLLSFSMAMICLMISNNATNLRDTDQKDTVYYTFVILMILFLALSIFVSSLEIQNQMSISKDLQNFQSSGTGISDPSSVLKGIDERMVTTSNYKMMIRNFTLSLTFFTVALAVFFKQRYKLED